MNDLAEQLFLDALEASSPYRLTKEALDELKSGKALKGSREVYLVATGKASVEMARAVRAGLSGRLAGGIVVTSYETDKKWEGITLLKASHPVPDETSVEAGRKVKAFIEGIPPDAAALFCISGGTSSLLCLPGEGITVEELSETFRLLNNSGATIGEMNAVRKHLSAVKGGQLLRSFDPGVTLIDLLISDVPDDDPAVIGSGPTTPDISTYQDSYHVLLEYGLWEKVPASVRNRVEQGIDGIVPDTVKPGEDPVKNHSQRVIGSARKLAVTAAKLAEEEGYNTWVDDSAYNDDVEEVASRIGEIALGVAVDQEIEPEEPPEFHTDIDRPAALLFYGESTVQVTGEGKGGRNQELALRGASHIRGQEKITWLSAGTDGVDGPTDAAGAVVDGLTIRKAREKGIHPNMYLDNNDSYHFHEKMGTLLKTGPTGNNLMDLQVIIID
ncbi:MAG: DUF4147 domain-containing protein [Balneolaceae bacterium]|nr:DUF4147 domain-containing protein [Balneolaceae bacterium]